MGTREKVRLYGAARMFPPDARARLAQYAPMTRAAKTSDKPKAHVLVRYTGRAALVSLILAFLALIAAQLAISADAPIYVRGALKFVVLAASAVSVTALLLWVLFSGVGLAFGRRDETHVEPRGDLW